MSKIKLTALCLSIAMLITFIAGCGITDTKQSTSTSEKVTSGSSSEPTTSSSSPKKDYYELNYLLMSEQTQPLPDEQNIIYKTIKEKFNVGIKVEKYAGDYQEKLALMLASNEYPELMRVTDSSIINKYVEAGALLDLVPLMDKVGPNFKKHFEPFIPALQFRIDQKDSTHFWYFDFGDPDDSRLTTPQLEMLVRSDILEENGYPNVITEDDYFDLIKKGVEQHPQTDGMNTVGFTLPIADGCTSIPGLLYQVGKFNSFVPGYDYTIDDFVDIGQYYGYKDALKFWNRLYRANLFDKEAFTDKWDQFDAKMYAGRSLTTFFCTWEYNDFNRKLQEAGKTYRYIPMPIMLKSQLEHNEVKLYMKTDVTTWDACAITKNAKDPERIMEVLDWVCTKEGQLLLGGWGQEGVDYTIVDGKRVPTAEHLNKIQTDTDFIAEFMSFDFLGAFNTMDENNQMNNILKDEIVASASRDPKITEVFSKYGWSNYFDEYTKNKNFKFIMISAGVMDGFDEQVATDELNKIKEKINELNEKQIPKVLMSKSDEEFEINYNDMISQRDALGNQQLLTYYQERYKTVKEKYGSIAPK